MIRSAILAFAVALCLGTPVLAGDLPTESHKAAAVELLDASNSRAMMMQMIDAMAPMVVAQLKQEHPQMSDKAVAAFTAAFKEEMSANVDGLMTMFAAVYVEHFSEADLKAITAFYRSDAGKHCLAEMPGILKETMPLGMKWGREIGPKAAERAIKKLEKEGVSL